VCGVCVRARACGVCVCVCVCACACMCGVCACVVCVVCVRACGVCVCVYERARMLSTCNILHLTVRSIPSPPSRYDMHRLHTLRRTDRRAA